MHAVTHFFWICKDFSDDIEAKNVNSKKIPVDLNSEPTQETKQLNQIYDFPLHVKISHTQINWKTWSVG